jgi:hypothetical protein
MSDAENQKMEKERIERERVRIEDEKATKLADTNKDKVLKTRRIRTTGEFMHD